MSKNILTIVILGMSLGFLSGCISGREPSDTYTDKAGKTSVIRSDREQCEHSCNVQYSRCGETAAARTNSGVNGPSIYGASGECRSDLSACMIGCKSHSTF